MNNDEIEPDMESDPTLASCCQRELKDRRVKQTKLDAVRSGMPASVSCAWHLPRVHTHAPSPDSLRARAFSFANTDSLSRSSKLTEAAMHAGWIELDSLTRWRAIACRVRGT